MFKRLLFGNEESKLQFKTSTTSGIARLFSDPSIPASDSLYWRSYLQLFDSPTDVFSLVSVSDIRRALTTYPENVATLVQVLVKHLESLEHDVDFAPLPQEGQMSGMGSNALTAGLSRNVAGWMPNLGGKTSYREEVVADSRDRVREALNCCRILARVLPVIMEGDHDASCNVQADGSSNPSGSLSTDEFEKHLLWSESSEDSPSSLLSSEGQRGNGPTARPGEEEQENQFVIAESDEDDEERPSTDPLRATEGTKEPSTSEKSQSGPTLGERLTSTVINLLFYSGFTVPWTDEQLSMPSTTSVAASRIHYSIWEKGIGSSVDLPGLTKAQESHRVEVLRLLLVLLSKSIYIPAHLQTSSDNLSLRYVSTSLGRSVVLPLLCSLINVSVVRVKAEGWLGGLASLPAGLVKERLASGVEDVRGSTTTLSLQILNILLGYEGPAVGADQDNTPATPWLNAPRPPLGASASSQSIQSMRESMPHLDRTSNLFRLYLSKLHRQSDFELLSEGIFTILSQRLNPTSLLSPTASATDTSSAGPHIPEAMLLLWQLLLHNSKFRTFLLDDSLRSPQLLSHLLYHALNNKDSAARQGFVRLAIFILQDISCDRGFAINVCKAGSGTRAKITGGQRWGVAAGGGSALPTMGAATAASQSQASTGADILIQSVYSLIASTKSTLSALYPPLIITITNLSPFFKNLSILSSNRLLALFSSFSNPGFLLADEGNPRLIYYLLEAINLIIQHGFNRNPNLIYALVRGHRQVERLAKFTLRGGIADMRRVRKRAGVVESSLGVPRSESVASPPEKKEAEGVLDDTLGDGAAKEEGQEGGAGEGGTGEGGGGDADASRAAASEKARGKMRRTSVSSEGTIRGQGGAQVEEEDEEDRLVAGFGEEELWYAASTIGRNGFVPTQAWVTSWQKGLPLDTLQLTLLELLPRVQELCSSISSKSDADERVLAFLRDQSLVNVLPPASAVQPRLFKWNPQVSIWLLSYLWGLIYLSSSLPFGIFVGSNARLFQLRIQDGNSSGGARRAGRNSEQLALLNVGNMVFGGLSQVLGLGSQQSAPLSAPPHQQSSPTSSS